MEHILELAEKNQREAWEVIRKTDVMNIWKSVGAEINLVGSLNMGLLVKNRDVDFHIYSSPLTLAGSFMAMAKLAENPFVKRITYNNLLDTEEACIEWHVWYEDPENGAWKMDMIHILKHSRYDGYFEKMAERIKAVLTEETRKAILRLKYDSVCFSLYSTPKSFSRADQAFPSFRLSCFIRQVIMFHCSRT